MYSGTKMIDEPIRWGLLGGGYGSQIGYIHRSAATRDYMFDLVAGSFHEDHQKSKKFGIELHVDPERCYPDYKTMFREEAARPDGIQAVTIATPNYLHYEMCVAALEYGLHVMCEKPLCFTLDEALKLEQLAKEKNRAFGISYGYSGFPLIMQARQMVQNGDLGEIRVMNMQLAHGFHNVAMEEDDNSAKWRVTPELAGPSYVVADLGTHVLHLSEIIAPQLKISKLLCTKQSFVKSRAPMEDNAYILMEYESGAVSQIWSSAINSGSLCGNRIRIVGEKASLEWISDEANYLYYYVQGEAPRVLERGMSYLYPEALQSERNVAGNPEGFFESWSNIYNRFGRVADALDKNQKNDLWYPNIHEGVEGVRWVENCMRSANNGSVWVDYR